MKVSLEKPVEHAGPFEPQKVLINLEDFTSLRGGDLIQSIYWVVMGFNLNFDNRHMVFPLEAKRIALDPLKNPDKTNHFFCWYSPLYQVQKGRKHHFPNGLPLYYGRPGRQASIYVAAFSPSHQDMASFQKDWKEVGTDKGIEAEFIKSITNLKNITETVQALEQLEDTTMETLITNQHWEMNKNIKEINNIPQPKEGEERRRCFHSVPPEALNLALSMHALLEKNEQTIHKQSQLEIRQQIASQSIRRRMEQEQARGNHLEQIKRVCSLMIKRFETNALEAGHNMRYSNVFTVRDNDNWLEGGHKDWGDHRIAMTINVELA